MRNEELLQKWKPVLEHSALPGISDRHRMAVTATLLENTESAIREESGFGGQQSLLEAGPSTSVGTGGFGGANNDGRAGYDPVLISLVRRAMPNLIAYDICGVQPMTGPTGLIFAMRSKYQAPSLDISSAFTPVEAMYNEADIDFSANIGDNATDGTQGNALGTAGSENLVASGLTTTEAEALGSGVQNDGQFAEMSFSIDKVAVTAKSRALKAEYTTELAQDLKAIHGLDAEQELANMLSSELLAEINREVVRTVYQVAVAGAQGGVASNGTFNLDVDANGRWSVEKFKGLMFQIEKEANAIAKATRRGKGNMIICSSDVASALQMAGVLDYTPALNANNLNPDDTGNTFAGVLNGRFRVYIDPYAGANYMVVGYKGSSTFDAGLFYCPYVPLQMVRAVGENSFQSKLGFKTRYGMIMNPFAQGGAAANDGQLTQSSNVYYRRVSVTNLL
jgi:hypothetical protein